MGAKQTLREKNSFDNKQKSLSLITLFRSTVIQKDKQIIRKLTRRIFL